MIEVKNLVKKYGDHLAVDDLSFTVERGQILGFLGPNGVGKSTTMNMITGYIAATSGTVTADTTTYCLAVKPNPKATTKETTTSTNSDSKSTSDDSKDSVPDSLYYFNNKEVKEDEF